MLQIHVIHVQRNALHIHCTSNGSTYTHIIHYEFTISYVRIIYTSCPSSFMYTAYYRCYTFIFYILIHVHIYTVQCRISWCFSRPNISDDLWAILLINIYRIDVHLCTNISWKNFLFHGRHDESISPPKSSLLNLSKL